MQVNSNHCEAVPPSLQVAHLAREDECFQGMLLGDEWANSLTHGLGLFLSFIALFFLLEIPLRESDAWRFVNFAIYGATLILLYGASTFYHAAKKREIKRVMQIVDHCAIYLLIAGTYTPFTMLLLEGLWGQVMFGIVWSLAILGILFKIAFKNRFKVLSTSLYLLMGWLVVFAAEPLAERLHVNGIYWVLGGGLSYTAGVVFYALDKRRFFHAIWHLFVLGGSICHYVAILFYL